MPSANLGEAEDGGRVGDAEVGGERELEAAAEAVAVDRAEGRLGERGDRLVHAAGLAVVGEDRLGVSVGELGDVGAGRERAAAAR